MSKFEEASIMMGTRGGVNYNLLFSNPNSTLIELIPNINTNRLADFSLASGMNYFPIVLHGSTSDQSFYVDTVDITDALKTRIEGI